MYKDPANFNIIKGAIFKSYTLKTTKCLSPEGTCTEEVIDSHSIQDKRILEQLAKDYHVIQIQFDKSCISKSTFENPVPPACTYESISVHKATVFNGLCLKDDTAIFLPIDTQELNMDNPEHVFLLTYRSVLKELVTRNRAAAMSYSVYIAKVNTGEISEYLPTEEMILSMTLYKQAYDFSKYKKQLDSNYLSKAYDNIAWRYLILDNAPTFATASIFRPVEIEYNQADSALICVNIFPYNNQVYVLFSCRTMHESVMNAYTDHIFSASGECQKYLISKLVLRYCENTVISPDYFNSWSDSKKNTISEFFHCTVNSQHIEYDSPALYLF